MRPAEAALGCIGMDKARPQLQGRRAGGALPTMGIVDLLPLVRHLSVSVAIGVFLLWIFRRVRAQSPHMGHLLAAGLLLRAAAGLALFWVSYLDSGWLGTLHSGDGFWWLAEDGRSYFRVASSAVESGLGTISIADASPAYSRMLALWMHLVGVSPPSAFFLNLTLYVLFGGFLTLVFRLTGEWRADAPCVLTFAAFTFSPALLIHGTQPLKDEFFALLIAGGAIGSLAITVPLAGGFRTAHHTRAFAIGLCLLLGTVVLIAGIRTYFAFILLGSLALVLALFTYAQRRRLALYVPMVALTLLLTGWACVVGGGPYAEQLTARLLPFWPDRFQGTSAGTAGDASDGVRGVLSEAGQLIESSRAGFMFSGGGTNVTDWASGNPAGNGAVLAMGRVALGAALIFVPVSLLRAVSLVDFEGGRGMLMMTDLDTLFLNATFAAVFVLLWRRRSGVGENIPYAVLLIILAIVTTGLLAYIVTNFGTLFRLRLMMAVPLWMLPLALMEHRLFARATAHGPRTDAASWQRSTGPRREGVLSGHAGVRGGTS